MALFFSVVGGWFLALSAHLFRFERREYLRCCFAMLVFIAALSAAIEPLARMHSVLQILSLFGSLLLTILIVMRPKLWQALAATVMFVLLPELLARGALLGMAGRVGG
ncbi:hypothetical protein HNQ51_003438 [Inhella inkyongensis]|uniref:Uncharacterized protein n=1 Tax=Inhella inkyongensis TaxID=392593 RepID=A0A840S6M9_9BURK|nr:hypothetical protein [Inhella inkyongensis]MBB5206095.1 hypothetical protein [Inhella inkyongensis]